MGQGNKDFLMGLAGAGAPSAPARLPPRTSILAGRENRLAELTRGSSQTRLHELVDPARCRIWQYHNRDYAALSEGTCADLLESIKAQGRQEVPAIVRRVSDATDHDWEVICGARRHWTISWLRAHNHPEMKFLIEPRELTDEEAFRLADLENRSRKDLSDYERATDYARAVDLFYNGSQQRMVERLEVSKSWLSRYLELAKLPAPILAAFGTPHALGISHAATLAPLLKAPKSATALIEAADALASEQRERHLEGSAYLSPAVCVQRLLARGQGRAQRVREHVPITIKSAGGDVLLKAQMASRGGALTITVPAAAKLEPAALEAGFSELMKALYARIPLHKTDAKSTRKEN